MQLQEIRSQLIDRARRLGLEGDNEEALLDALLDRELAVPEPTEEECRRWYDEHPEACRDGDMVEADHILFAVTARTPLAALREHAGRLLVEALTAPERFAQRAAECSNCPSAQVGGSLGQLRRGDVVPEFWQAIAASDTIGVLPQLVESRYGLHIVRVARRVRGRTLPFDAVRAQIMARLAHRKLQTALRDYAHALVHGGDEHQH